MQQAVLSFEQLSFFDEEKTLRIHLLKRYVFHIPKDELAKIGSYVLEKNSGTSSITFSASKRSAETKFHFLLAKYSKELRHLLNNKHTVYIHKNSGIPLMGNTAFGIVDRGSSLIEIKPSTGCNINCTFCSVDEGKDSKRLIDIVIEKDYLVEELAKIITQKKVPLEIHIGVHGEPLIYPDLIELIADCAAFPAVSMVSMNTNGTLFTPAIIDAMTAAAKGKLRINFSINAIAQQAATTLAGTYYPIEQVKKSAAYAVTKCEVNISPVWLKGVNDKDIEDVIQFALSIKVSNTQPRICIQNFMEYDHGRNPIKPQSWEDFYAQLRVWEKKYDVQLLMSPEEFHIVETEEVAKPFRKGEIVSAVTKMPGRLARETIAVAQNRCISIMSSQSLLLEKEVRVKITRDKHNIFFGVLA